MFIPRTVTTIAPDAFADSRVIYILGYEGIAAPLPLQGAAFFIRPCAFPADMLSFYCIKHRFYCLIFRKNEAVNCDK